MFLLLGEDETSERLISEMEAFLEADRGTPREQIDFLHAASERIFPDAGDISYNVLYVDPIAGGQHRTGFLHDPAGRCAG